VVLLFVGYQRLVANRQINCLEGIGAVLGDEDLWRMQNGYALASEEDLRMAARHLRSTGPGEISDLRRRLRVGIHRETEVTLPGAGHTDGQVYISALPVVYSAAGTWATFARLVLGAAYEATLRAGIRNARQTGNRAVYLTLPGGGAFGSRSEWIISAIRRAFDICQDWPPDVAIVSYGRPGLDVSRLVSDWS
jgi:hypothetical protein